jgi:CDP-paratose 2-epimerase
MNTVLVTGGAGFVGAALALGLKAAKTEARVIALDNLKRRGSELNLPRLKAGGVEFVHGDIRNPEDLEAVGPVDLILECSAEPSVLAGYGGSPAYVVRTNLEGTINCLEIARKHGAVFLFLSTSRVYPIRTIADLNFTETETRFELAANQSVPGVSPAGIAENFSLEGTRSLYGATKLASELLLQEYREMYGFPAIINRCGVIAGPWQMGKVDQGVVVLWAARHFFNKPLQYIGFGGTGKQTRDVLHIDDLVRLVLYELDHLGDLDGQTFNVGGGREVSVSLQELTGLCRDATGNFVQIDAVPETRVADIPLYLTDNAKITAATGWHPEKNVEQIVADVVAWLSANREGLAAILS